MIVSVVPQEVGVDRLSNLDVGRRLDAESRDAWPLIEAVIGERIPHSAAAVRYRDSIRWPRTGDEATDLTALQDFFRQVRGKHPEQAFPPPAT